MFRSRTNWLAPSILSIQLVWCSVECAQTESEVQTAEATSETKQAAPIDPTGTWEWEYSFNENAVEGKLKLNWDGKELAGKYTAFDRTTDFEEIKLDKDQLSFISKRELNGNEFVVKFSGKVKPDDIEGTVAIDFDSGSQEFDWNPKRVVEIDDVVGVWDLRVETENGVVEPKLTITKDGEKLRGKSVSSTFGELEAKNLVLKDNDLSWEITAQNGGFEFHVKYKGKPRGNVIVGSNEFSVGGNAGTMEFTGKRTPPEEKEKPANEATPAGEAAAIGESGATPKPEAQPATPKDR